MVTRKRAVWRRLAWFVGIGLMLTGLLVVTLPLWFPWVARPVLRPLGFGFGEYRATGYTTFEMGGVRGVIGGVQIEVARVEGWLPTAWVWHRLLGEDSARLEVTVTDWEVRIRGMPEPRPEPKDDRVDTTFEVMDIVEGILAKVRFWVPLARIGRGVVDVHGDRLEVEEAVWENGRVTGAVRVPWFDGWTRVAADLTSRERVDIKADSAGLQLGAEVELVRQASVWEVGGTMIWEENRIPILARFGDEGWLPGMARLGHDRLRVSSERFGLTGYGDVMGRIDLVWDGERFDWEASAEAVPEGERASVLRPPMELRLQGRGDVQWGMIEELQVRFPWLRLELADGVRWEWWSGRWWSGLATLDVGIDLRGMPGLRLDGLLEGRIELARGEGHWPEATFELGGKALEAWEIPVMQARAGGRLSWPRLEVQTIDLMGEDGSTFEAEATVDLELGWVESGRWSYAGDRVQQLLPEWIGYQDLQADGELQGAFERLTHTGAVRADGVSVRGLNRAKMGLIWEGEGLTMRSVEVQWESGHSRLGLEAAIELRELEPVQLAARIDGVTLVEGDQVHYHLVEPFEVVWRQVVGGGRTRG